MLHRCAPWCPGPLIFMRSTKGCRPTRGSGPSLPFPTPFSSHLGWQPAPPQQPSRLPSALGPGLRLQRSHRHRLPSDAGLPFASGNLSSSFRAGPRLRVGGASAELCRLRPAPACVAPAGAEGPTSRVRVLLRDSPHAPPTACVHLCPRPRPGHVESPVISLTGTKSKPKRACELGVDRPKGEPDSFLRVLQLSLQLSWLPASLLSHTEISQPPGTEHTEPHGKFWHGAVV